MATLDLLSKIDEYNNINCHTTCSLEDCSVIISKYNIKVMSLNIRSINKNFNKFLVALARLSIDFDILVLTECWLNEATTIKTIEGYISFHTVKHINRAGGVVVYVRRSLSVTVKELVIPDANCLFICVPNYLSLFAVYRSPTPTVSNPCSFLNSLTHEMESLNLGPCSVFIGDINIDICNSTRTESLSSRYLCLLAGLGFTSAINQPTHNKTCLDHIFVNTNNKCESVNCLSDITDHNLVMIGISTNKKKPLIKDSTNVRIDYKAVSAELSDVDWSPVLNCPNIDLASRVFVSTLTDIVNKHSRKTKASSSYNIFKPWMTQGLLKCSKHKDKLHAESRKYPNDSLKKLIFTRYRNFYVSLLRKLKINYFRNQLNQNLTKSRPLWNTINSITQRTNKSKIPFELTKLKNDPITSLNECNSYFSCIGSDLAKKSLSRLNETQDSLAAKITLSNSPSQSFFMQPTDEVEVSALILNLKPNSAPGLDGLGNNLIKSVMGHLLTPLTAIFNMSLSTGVFPGIWKEALVIPIFKAGLENDPSNYRPISLLPTFSKLLEALVNKRLVKYLEDNKLLSDKQFGFRRSKSSEDAINLLTKIVSSQLDMGLASIGIFLDLAKAFDTVSIPILIKKLEGLGVRGCALEWFLDYLSHRKQNVKVGSYVSDTYSMNFGIPQGSILGPTLFLCYINDIYLTNLPNAEIISYADDTALIFYGKTWKECHTKAEDGLRNVGDWLDVNLLTLNTIKTNFICFHKTLASAPNTTLTTIALHKCKSQHNLEGQSSCRCDSIKRVQSLKYLGILVDERLTFREHILSLTSKIRKNIYIMRMLREVADTELLVRIYKALCQSLLTYGILSWGGCSSSVLITLERAQRAVLKVMFKKPFQFPTVKVYESAKVLSVRRLYIFRACLCAHKTALGSSNYHSKCFKRTFLFPTYQTKTKFAQRFGSFLIPFLYNKVIKIINLRNVTLSKAKQKIHDLLVTWPYEQSESFMKTVS